MSKSFLSKKSWHTGSLKNQEKVWLREQEKKAEDKKLKELQRQLAEERQMEELRASQRASGLKTASNVVGDHKLDWMYQGPPGEGGMAGREEESLTEIEKEKAEQFLLGKEIKMEPEKGDLASVEQSQGSLLSGVNSASAQNEQWRRVHSDPLLEIKRREAESLKAVLNNPLRMKAIREALEAKTGKPLPGSEGGVAKEEEGGEGHGHTHKHRHKHRHHRKHRRREGEEGEEVGEQRSSSSRRHKRRHHRSRSRSPSEKERRHKRHHSEHSHKRRKHREREEGDQLEEHKEKRQRVGEEGAQEEEEQQSSVTTQPTTNVRRPGYGLVMTESALAMQEAKQRQQAAYQSQYVARSYKPPSRKEKEESEAAARAEARARRSHSAGGGGGGGSRGRPLTAEEKAAKLAQMQSAAAEMHSKRQGEVDAERRALEEEKKAHKASGAAAEGGRSGASELAKPGFIKDMQKAVYSESNTSLQERMEQHKHYRQTRGQLDGGMM